MELQAKILAAVAALVFVTAILRIEREMRRVRRERTRLHTRR
jgi:hypothetical protein